MDFDTSYLNTTPGKYKISCMVLGAIGLLALFITNVGNVYQYSSVASLAFLVTLILLLILVCVSSLRQSALWLKVELIITVILTIMYIVGTVYIFKTCWHFLFDNFQMGYFIGSLIATICSIFATLTYAADTALKFREVTGSGSTSNV